MIKRDIIIGAYYITNISNKPAAVRIDSESRYGGWNGTNMNTNRSVRIKSARKLQRECSVHEVERFQSSKARATVRNGHSNGENGVCEVCGEPTNRPHHNLCYTHWLESSHMNIGNKVIPTKTGRSTIPAKPRVGDQVTVNGGTITLYGKDVTEDDIIQRMTDRIAPVVMALRKDAESLDKRGFHQYATDMSNVAYAVEAAMLDSIEDILA